jgi:hypothetical protein
LATVFFGAAFLADFFGPFAFLVAIRAPLRLATALREGSKRAQV